MAEDIIIIGAGGLGREVLWLLEELNEKDETWNIKGFVDDNSYLLNTIVNDYPVLGNTEWLTNYSHYVSVVCCIAQSEIRATIISKLSKNPMINFPNIIASNVKYSKRVRFGKGNIICLSSTLTVDITIGDYNIINPACSIGHDVVLNDYSTIYPGVNISGNVNIGNYVQVGTGTQIIQGLSVCDNTTIGAGSVVIRNINEKGTYVGVPVKKIH